MSTVYTKRLRKFYVIRGHFGVTAQALCDHARAINTVAWFTTGSKRSFPE